MARARAVSSRWSRADPGGARGRRPAPPAPPAPARTPRPAWPTPGPAPLPDRAAQPCPPRWRRRVMPGQAVDRLRPWRGSHPRRPRQATGWDGSAPRHRLSRRLRKEPEDRPHGTPHHAAAEGVIPGEPVAEPVRKAEDPLAHRYPREHVVDEMGGALGHAASAAARAQCAALAGERDEPVEAAPDAAEPGERVHGLKLEQRAREQSRGGQHHRGHRELRDDERAPGASARTTGRSPGVLERRSRCRRFQCRAAVAPRVAAHRPALPPVGSS